MVFVVVVSVVVCVAVILLLTAAIVIVETNLVPSEKVNIDINEDSSKSIATVTGGTLLSTLAANDVLLPSACGGRGTCGVCKCQVISGGGDVLPTEETFITRRLAKDHWRLACQVKVKQNMSIRVPDEVFSISKWDCEVVSNRNVATFIKEFVIKLPPGEFLDFQPGGYIQVEVPHFTVDFNQDIDVDSEYRGDWEKFGVFNLKLKNTEPITRAYSMANHPAEGNFIKLNVRIATPPWDKRKNRFQKVPAGICSSYIFSKKPGDKVTVSGPYGEFFINKSAREMLYIGGGAGMAPLRSHIVHLLETEKTKRTVSFWYGGRSKRELFYLDDFKRLAKKKKNFSFHVALSDPMPADNWTGHTGFIHQVVLDEYLSTHPAPEDIEYYLCGPPLMLSAVTKMLDDLGVDPEMIRYDDFG